MGHSYIVFAAMAGFIIVVVEIYLHCGFHYGRPSLDCVRMAWVLLLAMMVLLRLCIWNVNVVVNSDLGGAAWYHVCNHVMFDAALFIPAATLCEEICALYQIDPCLGEASLDCACSHASHGVYFGTSVHSIKDDVVRILARRINSNQGASKASTVMLYEQIGQHQVMLAAMSCTLAQQHDNVLQPCCM
ncbi:hypothetical protein Tco_0231673 [Tanacetum coccineum]